MIAHVWTECPSCCGERIVRTYIGGRLSDWVSHACHRCGGEGWILADDEDGEVAMAAD